MPLRLHVLLQVRPGGRQKNWAAAGCSTWSWALTTIQDVSESIEAQEGGQIMNDIISNVQIYYTYLNMKYSYLCQIVLILGTVF